MQSIVVGGADGGGRCSGRTIIKTRTSIKNKKWDGPLDVRILFEDDLARSGHPLCVETMNNQGFYVLKIKCCICSNFLSYYSTS